jgi:hypothetical protein
MFRQIFTTGLFLASTVMATPTLFEFGLNINGETNYGYVNEFGDLTGLEGIKGINAERFDFATGLGTLSVYLNDKTSSCNLLLNMDIDLDNFGFETGIHSGIETEGLAWEIDDYLTGDIYGNFESGLFDNSNALSGSGDIVMGLGWNNIDTKGFAKVDFTVSNELPIDGFYLSQSYGSETVYFSTSNEVPEPGSVTLLLSGLAMFGFLFRKKKSINNVCA